MAENISSPGLLGLSHYRNSRVAQSKWEPIYQNLFTVDMDVPLALQNDNDADQRKNIILEGVKSLGQISTSKASSAVNQTYKFAKRSFANATPETTDLTLSINFQLNLSYDGNVPSNYTYNFLRQWVDAVYDPLTGRQGLKKDYASNSMTVTMHDRAGTPYWQWTFYNIWPTTGVPGPTLDYNSTTLLEASMTFQCDYWDEVCL